MPDIEYCAQKRILTVFLSGELDHHSTRPVREQTDLAIAKRRPALLVLDFSRVTFMDSSGIGLIMGRYRLISDFGGDILVANPPEGILKLLKLGSVEKIVRIVYTAHSAAAKE